jgi:large subunit ribosomal protein L25
MKAETLNVSKRTDSGKLATRRLRREGRLPAVLYGHKEPSISLALEGDQLHTTLRHGAKVVQLAGDLQEQALLQDIQWDTFGREVLHVDLLRIAKGERVHVEIEVSGRGESAGERDGGVVTWVVHSVQIEVTPSNIPERLHIDLADLNLGESKSAGDIFDLPEGATLLTSEDTVMVNCSHPVGDVDEDASLPAGEEPEVVKKDRKESDEDDEKDEKDED